MNGDRLSGFHIDAVKKPAKLHGWNKEGGLLRSLLSSAASGRSFYLRGERRSGKTSLLHCLMAEISKSYRHIVPVYVDCQLFAGFETPYNYVLSLMAGALMERIEEGEVWADAHKPLVGGHDLEKLASASEENLNQMQSEMAYKKLTKILKKNHKQMLLLFDEYEYFALCGNKKTSFTPFRSQMDNYSRDDGGIFCVISGVEDLSDFCNRIGSPQFNLFTKEELVPPLEREDFYALWEDCRSGCNESARRLLDKCCPGSCCPDLATLYELCGGRPAFAKILGDTWCQDGERDALNILQNWFDDIYKRQTEERKKLLLGIASDIPQQETADTEYLVKMSLAARNPDKESGGFYIWGGLWKHYLIKRSQVESEETIASAWDLARLIVKRHKLQELLKKRRGKGEKDDWLEFKSGLIPNAEQMESDNKLKNKKYKKDDYIWHFVKAILAMRNTRGGLILFGVDDDASIIGLETKGLSDGDFMRKYFVNKINKKEFSLGDCNINLDNCDWDFTDTPEWIDYNIADICGKKIMYVCVKPIIPDEHLRYYIKDSDVNYQRSSKYILIRNNQENKKLYLDDDKEKIHTHFEKMQNPNTDALEQLRDFWQQLCMLNFGD